jgi:protein-S-isoprenylcysteine O-methyltransferase Ste14
MLVMEMDDRTRFKMVIMTTVFVIIGVLAFMMMVAINEPLDSAFGVLMILIAAVIVLLPLLILLRTWRDLKEGFPLMDERGNIIKQKAGYYSYLATIYIILGFMYYDFIGVEAFEWPALGRTESYMLLEIIILLIFGGFWLWFARKGEKTDGA